MKLQRLGGYDAIASLCFTITYEIMASRGADMMDAAKTMAALSTSPVRFVVLFLLVVIVAILAFVVRLALYERMQANAPYLTRVMLIAASASIAVAITGSIVILIGGELIIAPTQDVSAFRALTAMIVSLAMMVHHTSGWAQLLIGCAVLKTHSFSRILGWLCLFAGIMWIPITIVPQLLRVIQLIAIASLLSGVCTIWIGISLLRQKQPQSTAKEMVVTN